MGWVVPHAHMLRPTDIHTDKIINRTASERPVVRCTKCPAEAVTYIRYNGNSLCPMHFTEYVDKRIKKEIRSQLEIGGGKHIAVAISGGKDSAVTLEAMVKILGHRRDIRLSAFTVDEGIVGYRPATMKKVIQLTERLGIEHRVVSFQEEVGTTMDELAPISGDQSPCSYCGVFRRRCMNKAAKELGADIVATGHNLDDTAQSVLMNFMRGDVERLARLGPHLRVQPGLIPRIEPLRLIPEKESYLYALLNQIEFSDDECPYAGGALRNDYRAMIDEMEQKHPGTKFSIVSSYDAIRPMLKDRFPASELKRCACGEPTCNERCMACEMMSRAEACLQKKRT
jgi:uncharacterized protein (TIGR00269 family)